MRMGSYRKSNQKKERIVMLASSVLVLAALTMTGIYIQNEKEEIQDDGYTLDFTQNLNQQAKEEQAQPIETDSELDYMPLEAGSDKIKIPGVTDVVGEKDPKLEAKNNNGKKENEKNTDKKETKDKDGQIENENPSEGNVQDTPAEEPSAETTGEEVIVQELHFSEEDGLLRPVEGEVLLPFSMDKSVYFQTLDQYKYHSAVLLQAEEGTPVAVAAEGKVIHVFQDPQLGNSVTVDLGDGYLMTYGQLKDLAVAEGDYVNVGATLAVVAVPTKYYSKEGANLYLQLTKDNTPINPENLFR